MLPILLGKLPDPTRSLRSIRDFSNRDPIRGSVGLRRASEEEGGVLELQIQTSGRQVQRLVLSLFFLCVCVCGCGTEQVPRVGGDVLEVSIDTLKNDPIINQQKLGNHG